MKVLGLLLLSPCAAIAYQLPFSIPFLSPFRPSANDNSTSENVPNVHRIAIIGAGAAGSSAAFWLSKAQNRSHLEMAVDVFEKDAYVGGRSTIVYPYNSSEYEPVELGASIFVKANKNLWRAVKEFNLSLKNFDDVPGEELGIWDGKEFRFRASGSFGWWDMIKLFWRYGIDAPRRSQAMVTKMVDTFITIYKPETPQWENLTELSTYLGFANLTAQTTEAFLDSQNINKQYSSEMIEGMTRVNYGQNLDQIHALEGLVSQAANGASSVQGGNFQIFEQFLARSNAKLYLNMEVNSLTRESNKWSLVTHDGESRLYDSIILAAPFHSTGIKLTPSPRTPIPKQPYVHLHVTYLSTSSPTPNPEYFSLPSGSAAPTTILTTNDGFVHGGPGPDFNSLGYREKAAGHSGRPSEYIVKLFSARELPDPWLYKVFGKVGWILRKEWDAYPRLPPTTSFPPVKPDEGLYYVNSFEPFISTMETETISAQNVVQLLVTEVWGSNATSCSAARSFAGDGELMKGWDC